jgi:hypothetical protein
LGIRSNFSAADLPVPGRRWAGPDKSGNYKNLEVKCDGEYLFPEKKEAAYKMPPEV